MPSQRDPEGIASKHLYEFADLANARVLEIGCGDGHLTWRYAAAAKRVVGIDPNAMRLAVAYRDRPSTLRTKVRLAQTSTEALPFSSETFDVAILSWSL